MIMRTPSEREAHLLRAAEYARDVHGMASTFRLDGAAARLAFRLDLVERWFRFLGTRRTGEVSYEITPEGRAALARYYAEREHAAAAAVALKP